MSKFARALILGAMLASMNLAGMTAVAQAQVTDQHTSKQDARRPPTEGQVGESWRHRQVASPQQTPADAALGQVLAQEHSSIPSGTPAELPAPARPAEPSGQSGWLVLALSVLSAALALVAGLAVLAARRASRRLRAGQAA
jgi:hypothetical protein